MRARVSDLRNRPDDDPDATRRAVAELVRDLTDSAFGIWYRFGLVDGEPCPVEWHVRGGTDRYLQRATEERLPWPGGDPRLPERRTVNRFILTSSVLPDEQMAQTAFFQRVIVPMEGSHQARMMVYSKGRHIGWIGAMRGFKQPPFAARELRRLRSAAPAIADALVQADAAARTHDPLAGCDLVLDASGRIELASATAAPIIAHPERTAMVQSWARSADRDEAPPRVLAGQRISWSRLTGSSGVRYLLHLEPVEPVRLRRDFELSATQRRVAEYAAAGAQVAEIAEAVGIAPTTVKTHLRAAYATLGIGSRAELAQALQGQLPD